MRRLLPAIALASSLALLAFLPGVAAAHEITVLPVGSGELDAGTAEPARLIHATLDGAEDELVVTARSTGAPIEVLLLVPAREPELDATGGALPRLSLEPAGDAGLVEEGDERIADEGTAVEYRVVGSRTIAVPAGTSLTLRVARGTEPTRAALRIGPPSSFEAADIERTPRALGRLRIWDNTPAPSSDYVLPTPKTQSRRFVAWYGAGIALLGVLIGAWWVWAGRRRSRERGAERAAAEHATGEYRGD